MCGRYQLFVREKDISIRFHVEVYENMYRPTWNAAPSQKLPVITNQEPRQLQTFRWGLVPFWAKDIKIGYRMINAKAETIHEKASFKNPLKRKRCLVLSNGFYEWKKENNQKIPYRIYVKDEELFAYAGLWDTWKDAEGRETNSFTIITTPPNELMKQLHDRMPAVLEKEDEDKWLYENDQEKLLSLLKPFPAEKMEAYPVSQEVNKPQNNHEGLIAACGEKIWSDNH